MLATPDGLQVTVIACALGDPFAPGWVAMILKLNGVEEAQVGVVAFVWS